MRSMSKDHSSSLHPILTVVNAQEELNQQAAVNGEMSSVLKPLELSTLTGYF